MLLGQAMQMDTRVYKVENVSKMWNGQPVIFRMVMLPFVLKGIFTTRHAGKDISFIDLGAAGTQLDAVNPELAFESPSESNMSLVAFVANKTYTFGGDAGSTLKNHLITAMLMLQVAVWCLKGANIVFIVAGPRGGELPEWAWEFVNNGPQVTNVRLVNFDEPESPGDSNGMPPSPR
jgi:hypothetical protein